MVLGVWRGVGLPFCNAPIKFRSLSPAAVCLTLLQCQVVRDPENPAAKIAPRLAHLQVAEQREKYLLRDLFSVMQSDSERERVAKHRISILIEEPDHLAFER